MRRLPLLILALLLLALPLAGCGGDDADEAATPATTATSSDGRDRRGRPRRRQELPHRPHRAARRRHRRLPGARRGVRRARQAGRLRPRAAPQRAPRRGEPHPRGREGALDGGEPVLRAGRGHRRRHAVARRVRRHPRRRLEQGRGSRERRPVRPRALRRPHPRAAGQSLQPHRGDALGHAARADRSGGGRPRRGRSGGVRRGAAGRAGALRGGRRLQAVRRRAPRRGRGVAADRLGRVHLARRDGADDERVLRPVEGVALRPGRRGRERGVQRRLPPLRHQRHHLGPAGRLRRRPAGDRRGRRRRGDADRRGAGRARDVHLRPAGAGGGRQAVHARAGRPARRRRAGARRRRSRARSPSTQRSSGSRSSSSDAAGSAHRSRGRRSAGRRARRAPRHPPAGRGAVDARRDLGIRAERARARRARAEPGARRPGGRDSHSDRPGAACRDAAGRHRADSPRPRQPGATAPALARARARSGRRSSAQGSPEPSRTRRPATPPRARTWLLVREYRPPTRFTRAGTDATLALTALARGETTPRAAAQAVRADLLDTYEARLRDRRSTAPSRRPRRGYDARLAERAALARGYAAIVAPSYRSQRGAAALDRLDAALASLEQAAARGTAAAVERAAKATQAQLEGFRAAPLPADEQARRAGQLDRFLRLVPIEYDRGVEGGRVTVPFEIQEAITFRDAAAASLADIAPTPARARRRCDTRADRESRRRSAATSTPARRRPRRRARRARLCEGGPLARADRRPLPAGMEGGSRRRRLRRDRGLARPARERREAGSWSRAEQARLEAYGIFELGPEQRLRGIAPDAVPADRGTVLVRRRRPRRPRPAREAEGRAAPQLEAIPRGARGRARRCGSAASEPGRARPAAIVTNSAIVVFREGLEAVLILAALMASMVGANRRFRRPLLIGVGIAFVASAITWAIAQTVLGSLAPLRREARGGRLGGRDRACCC